MPRIRPSRFPFRPLAMAALLALLGACASGGGSVMPGGTSPPLGAAQPLSGTLGNVDHGNHRLLLQEDGGQRTDLSYDARTRLSAAGQPRPLAGLEPGDRVRVLVARDGRLWRAQDIELLADVRAGTADFSNVQSGSSVQSGSQERSGAVAGVDRRARLIRFTEGGFTGREDTARYDAETTVAYRGQASTVSALERGDLIRVRMRRSDTGWVAASVIVETRASER